MQRYVRSQVATATALVALLWMTAAAFAQQPPRELFSAPTAAPALDVAAETGVLRNRFVSINNDVLADAAAGDALALSLFDGSVTALVDHVEVQGVDTRAVVGRVQGVADSSVVLVTTAGVTAGTITIGDLQYQVRYAGNGVHAIRQFDVLQLPDEQEPLPVGAPTGDADADAPVPAGADSGNRFDVMVVYTAAARSAAGGTAAMQALINLGITETNQAYQNSGVIPRLRLVHMAEVAYTESGNLSTDLGRLTNTADGFIDNVHTLRNTYGADLVKLVTNSGNGCGVAWLMGAQSAAFAANAFSVTVRSCISPNYTFAHELGHNMGSNHAPDDPVGTGAFSYSYGHKVTGLSPSSNNYRTVMAYNTSCSCTRRLNFSNPSVSVNGAPTGTSTRNNATSINNVRNTVANWRQEVMLIQITSLWTVTQPGTSTAPQGGKPARLYAFVRNNGPNPLTSGDRVWFWVETQAGTGGSWVGSALLNGLAPGAGAWYSFDWSVPLSASGGWRYFARAWFNGVTPTSATTGPQNFTITAAPAVSAEVTSLWTVTGAKAGQPARLWARVRNNGTNALPSTANVWFQVTFPGGGTQWVGSAPAGGQTSGSERWYLVEWTIPFSPGAGSYQYRASVWTGSLISNIGGPQAFTVGAADAVAAQVLSLWPVSHPTSMPGSTLRFWALVRNAGTSALPTGARVWFLLDGTTWVGSALVQGLPSNGEQWYFVDWTVPAGFTGGTHSYRAQVWTSTAISPLSGRSLFTTGFLSTFNGSISPWTSVAGTWTNASSIWLYTDGLANTWSSASYSTSTFWDVDYEGSFWRNGEATATCLVLRGTPGTLASNKMWVAGYFFCYARDGRFWAFKQTGTSFTWLQTITNTNAVVQGSAWNRLRVRALGNQLSFYINDLHLWSGIDNSYVAGRVGVIQYGTGPLWVENVKAQPIQGGADAEADTISAEQRALNAAAVPAGDPTGR